jgi:hypothetical protein
MFKKNILKKRMRKGLTHDRKKTNCADLEQGFDYPEESIWLDQYTVVEADGKVSVYRNWFQDYTPETITEELSQGGFTVESLCGDLTGEPYTPASEWIGLVTRKRI